MKTMDKSKIAIIGLGYVGLPLAIEFKKKYSVVGFDIDQIRIAQLKAGIDVTNEIEFSDFKEAKSHLCFSSDEEDLAECTLWR